MSLLEGLEGKALGLHPIGKPHELRQLGQDLHLQAEIEELGQQPDPAPAQEGRHETEDDDRDEEVRLKDEMHEQLQQHDNDDRGCGDNDTGPDQLLALGLGLEERRLDLLRVEGVETLEFRMPVFRHASLPHGSQTFVLIFSCKVSIRS